MRARSATLTPGLRQTGQSERAGTAISFATAGDGGVQFSPCRAKGGSGSGGPPP